MKFTRLGTQNMLMKKQNYLIILLLILGSFISCKKDGIAYSNDFEKSYNAWLSFKKAANNSYRYTQAFSSWTGYSTATTFTINKGLVVKRSFIAKSREQTTNQLIIVEQWEEEGTSLNSHQNGIPLRTLDEIYQKAKTDWLLKRKNAKAYFEVKNNGMISTCGYAEDTCVDDCFSGVRITSIESL